MRTVVCPFQKVHFFVRCSPSQLDSRKCGFQTIQQALHLKHTVALTNEHVKHEEYLHAHPKRSANREHWQWELLVLQHIEPGLITAERQRRLTKSSLVTDLIQTEHVEKTSAIQSKPIQGPLALQSGFCRGPLNFCFWSEQKHKDPRLRKGFFFAPSLPPYLLR